MSSVECPVVKSESSQVTDVESRKSEVLSRVGEMNQIPTDRSKTTITAIGTSAFRVNIYQRTESRFAPVHRMVNSLFLTWNEGNTLKVVRHDRFKDGKLSIVEMNS